MQKTRHTALHDSPHERIGPSWFGVLGHGSLDRSTCPHWSETGNQQAFAPAFKIASMHSIAPGRFLASPLQVVRQLKNRPPTNYIEPIVW